MRPGDRQQMQHRVGRAADGAVDADGVLDRLAGDDLRHLQILMHHLDDAPAGEMGRTRRRASTAGMAALPGSAMPRDSIIDAMVEAVPMVLQLPADRLMALSAERNSAAVMRPAWTSSLRPEHIGAGTELLAAEGAGQHRSAGNHDGRQIAARRAHDAGGRGLVAADQQHDAVDGIGADRLLHIHAGEVAEHHGGGAQIGFAQRHHRKFDGKAAGGIDAALHMIGDLAQMRVAGGQLRPGVADADHRPPVEQVGGKALVLHPAAVDEIAFVFAPEPFLGAQLVLSGHGFLFRFALETAMDSTIG